MGNTKKPDWNRPWELFEKKNEHVENGGATVLLAKSLAKKDGWATRVILSTA